MYVCLFNSLLLHKHTKYKNKHKKKFQCNKVTWTTICNEKGYISARPLKCEHGMMFETNSIVFLVISLNITKKGNK